MASLDNYIKIMKITKQNQNKKDNRITTYHPVSLMIDEFFRSPFFIDDFWFQSNGSKSLLADLWEEDDNFYIKMAMPGVNKNDIDVTITVDTVTIKGGSMKKDEKDDKRRYFHKTIETYFEQTFNLPAVIDLDKAKADYEDGILSVTLPKVEESKPKSLKVE